MEAAVFRVPETKTLIIIMYWEIDLFCCFKNVPFLFMLYKKEPFVLQSHQPYVDPVQINATNKLHLVPAWTAECPCSLYQLSGEVGSGGREDHHLKGDK